MLQPEGDGQDGAPGLERAPGQARFFIDGALVLVQGGQVDVALQNRAFLVGPNASGKSNFLDAFRFLRDVVTSGSGFQKAVRDRGGVSRVRNLAARRYRDVVIQVALQEEEEIAWRYSRPRRHGFGAS
jgi:predicted ATPase